MNFLKSVFLCLLLICIGSLSDLYGQVSGSVYFRNGSPARGETLLLEPDLPELKMKMASTDSDGRYFFFYLLHNNLAKLSVLEPANEDRHCGIKFMDCAYVRDYIVYGSSGDPEADKYMGAIADVYDDGRLSALDVIVIARLALSVETYVEVPYFKVITSETNNLSVVMEEDDNIKVGDGDIQDLIILDNADIDGSCRSFKNRSSDSEKEPLSAISANYKINIVDDYSITVTLLDTKLDIGMLSLDLPDGTDLVDVSVTQGSSDLIGLHNSNEVILFPKSTSIASEDDVRIEMEFNNSISEIDLETLLGMESVIRFKHINHPLRLDDGFGFSIRNKNVASFQVVLNREIDGQFFISDASGRTLLQGPINGGNKTIEFNQNVDSGLYFVTIQEKENISTEKLIFIH